MIQKESYGVSYLAVHFEMVIPSIFFIFQHLVYFLTTPSKYIKANKWFAVVVECESKLLMGKWREDASPW